MEEDANPYSLSSESDRQAESKEEQGFSRSREESVPGGGGYISKDLELSTSLPGSMSFRRLHDGAGDLSRSRQGLKCQTGLGQWEAVGRF